MYLSQPRAKPVPRNCVRDLCLVVVFKDYVVTKMFEPLRYNPNVPTTVLKGLCCKDYVLNTVLLRLSRRSVLAVVTQYSPTHTMWEPPKASILDMLFSNAKMTLQRLHLATFDL